MLTYQPTRNSQNKSLAQVLNETKLALAFFGIGLLDCLARDPALAIVAFATGIVAYTYPKMNGKRSSKAIRWTFFYLIAASLAAFFGLVSTPVSAQFLQNMEEYFNQNFAAAGAAITTVFAGLRGIYLLYLVISLINVVNAARQDDNWQTAARTPVIVLIVVTVADVLTGVITG